MPRSAWTADLPPHNPTLLVDSEVRGFAVHWPGGGGSLAGVNVPQLLQGELHYHVDVRGWSDIAYQHAVDLNGKVWTLRGLDVRSAANGDVDPNRHYGAITCIYGPGDTPSAAMIQAIQDFRTQVWLKRFPHATEVKTHNQVRPAPTECPGPKMTALVLDGTLLRTPQQERDWLTMATEADVENAVGAVLGKDIVPAKEWRAELQNNQTLAGVAVSGARAALDARDKAASADVRGANLAAVVADLSRRLDATSATLGELLTAFNALAAKLNPPA